MVFYRFNVVGFGIVDTLFRYLPFVFLINAFSGGTSGCCLTLTGVFLKGNFKQTVKLRLVVVIKHHFLRIGFINTEEIGDKLREEARYFISTAFPLELIALAINICNENAVDLSGGSGKFSTIHR